MPAQFVYQTAGKDSYIEFSDGKHSIPILTRMGAERLITVAFMRDLVNREEFETLMKQIMASNIREIDPRGHVIPNLGDFMTSTSIILNGTE